MQKAKILKYFIGLYIIYKNARKEKPYVIAALYIKIKRKIIFDSIS